MGARSPAAESVVTGACADNFETSNSRDVDFVESSGRGVEPVAECKPSNEHLASFEEDHKKTNLAEGVAMVKACSQRDNAGTSSVEAAADHKDIDACHQVKEFENAEITLVVEMNADVELAQEDAQKGHEIMLREDDSTNEHGKDVTSSVQALEQVGIKEGDPCTTPKAPHQVMERGLLESIQQENSIRSITSNQQTPPDISASSKLHEAIERELGQNEVVTEKCTFLAIQDEIKGLETRGEVDHSLAKVQTREDSDRPHSEENLGSSRGLETKVMDSLDLASGSLQRVEALTNDEEKRDRDVGELAEMKVEADSGFRSCRKRAVEDHIKEDGLWRSELSEDVGDGERKKGRMVIEESFQLAEQVSVVVLEAQAGALTCTKDNEDNFVQGLRISVGKEVAYVTREQRDNFVQGSHNNLGEKGTDLTREQGEGGFTLPKEPRKDRVHLESGVHLGSLQGSEGRDRVREGSESVEELAVLTEAVGDKEVTRESGKSDIGMDTNITLIEKQRSNVSLHQHMENTVGGGTNTERQKLLSENEAGIPDKTSDICSMQSDVGMESPIGLGAKQVVTNGTECYRGNIAAVEKDEMNSLVGLVEVCSRNEFSKVMEVGQEAQRKAAPTPCLSGQDLGAGASSAVPSSLQFSSSDTMTAETSHTVGLQLDVQQDQSIHTEMQVRLQAGTAHERVEASSGRNRRELPPAKITAAKEDELGSSIGQHWRVGIVMKVKATTDTPVEDRVEGHNDTMAKDVFEERQEWAFQGTGYDNADNQISRRVFEEEKTGLSDEANTGTSEEEKIFRDQLERGGTLEKASQKRKLLDSHVTDSGAMNELGQNDNVVKKAKKKAVNVWSKTTSRKGPKKNSKIGGPQNPSNEDSVLLTPVYVNPDKVEDGPDQPIALSKYDKAEKIELSENRLSASSTKGYRMVRATRGVQEGTWYYEIVVEQLGPTGHTRLGWSTQKGDVQAPVGFDKNSYGYRDLDGSKTHVAVREPYGDLYVEGDVIGFYIHLPNGAEYAPTPAPLLSYHGRPYLSDVKEEHPRRVPGSEICYFRNGICQGTAFKDIYGGRYFPAASMYTLPKEPNCTVKFNFGPEFCFPPVDLDGRPEPTAMVHAPFHNAVNGKEVGPVAYANVSTIGLDTHSIEPQMKIV